MATIITLKTIRDQARELIDEAFLDLPAWTVFYTYDYEAMEYRVATVKPYDPYTFPIAVSMYKKLKVRAKDELGAYLEFLKYVEQTQCI